MLINALCRYYDVLASSGKVLPDGYSEVKISYLIELNEDGSIDNIIDYRKQTEEIQKNGKIKEIMSPRKEVMPKRTEKTAIESNIIEHRPLYIFGLRYNTERKDLVFDESKDKEKKEKEKARKSHEAFRQKNREFITGLDSPIVNAYRKFIDKWNPDEQVGNELLLKCGKEINSAGFGFCLSGHPEIQLHNDEQIKNKWLKELDSLENDDADDSSQCAILGKKAPIARIHNKIKGIPGGSSMGNTLINFNNSSDESYGKEQAYNSNISVLAMKKYTEALNYLMNNKKNRTLLDNTIVVHWAMSENETYDDFFNAFIFDDKIKSTEMDDILKDMFKNVTKGVIKTDVDLINDNLDANVEYYIVGFKPNSSRLAVKFIYRQNFGNLINNLLQNVKDLSINESKSNVALWQIKKELISPNSSNEEVNPALMAKLLDSIINGTAYPEGLLDTIIRRVKTDRDDDKNSYIKMNDTRMGIIKACINRKQRQNGKKEEIKMALDVENRSEAYLCGRLFYILENVQQKASDYGLNRTIKDSYFTSASTRPATVFPKLLSLSQYHMGKKENLSYSDKEITEIVDKLGTKFPKQLTLTEQGEFMLGYYQQKAYNIKQAKEYKENKDLLKED